MFSDEININPGGCLASCLTFHPKSTLNPKQLGCLYKKKRVPLFRILDANEIKLYVAHHVHVFLYKQLYFAGPP